MLTAMPSETFAWLVLSTVQTQTTLDVLHASRRTRVDVGPAVIEVRRQEALRRGALVDHGVRNEVHRGARTRHALEHGRVVSRSTGVGLESDRLDDSVRSGRAVAAMLSPNWYDTESFVMVL